MQEVDLSDTMQTNTRCTVALAGCWQCVWARRLRQPLALNAVSAAKLQDREQKSSRVAKWPCVFLYSALRVDTLRYRSRLHSFGIKEKKINDTVSHDSHESRRHNSEMIIPLRLMMSINLSRLDVVFVRVHLLLNPSKPGLNSVAMSCWPSSPHRFIEIRMSQFWHSYIRIMIYLLE